MKQNLTFDELPEAVNQLSSKLDNIEKLLVQQKEEPTPDPQDQFLTIQEAAKFLRLSVPTIYSKVSRGELPVMKRSKRLYFSSTELMAYIKKGRKKSYAEIEQEAAAYLFNNKKGLK